MQTRTLVLAISIVLFHVAQVNADVSPSCRSQDLTAHLQPLEEQGNNDTCWAYIGTELLSEHYHQRLSANSFINVVFTASDVHAEKVLSQVSNEIKTSRSNPTHAVFLSEEYRKLQQLYKYTGFIFTDRPGDQSIYDALVLARKSTLCDESEVPSDGGEASTTIKAVMSKSLTNSLELTRLDRSFGESGGTCTGASETSDSEAQISKMLAKAFTQEIRDRCKHPVSIEIPEQDIVQGGSSFSRWNSDGTLNTLDKTRTQVMTVIDEGLNLNRLVGIGYNVQFLRKNKKAGGHAATVFERECSSACECRYHVRNSSWGADPQICAIYDEPFATDCRASTNTFWLTSDQLKAYVSSSVYIK